MSYEQSQPINWSQNPISGCFQAAHTIIQHIYLDYSDKKEQGMVIDPSTKSIFLEFITGAIMKFDYSDDMKASVKAAAIKSAELILDEPDFYTIIQNWHALATASFTERNELCMEFTLRAQNPINTAFSMWRDWNNVRRETVFEMISEPKDENDNILKGSISFPVKHSESFGFARRRMFDRPLQKELIQMNTHPDNSAIHNMLEWLSVLVHETVHAIENIERRTVSCTPDFELAQNIDAQILLAEREHPQSYEERLIAYEFYRARPSERLARLAQDAFMQRMKDAFIIR